MLLYKLLYQMKFNLKVRIFTSDKNSNFSHRRQNKPVVAAVARDVEAEAEAASGSGPFSVEAEARKFHRFRFHIGLLVPHRRLVLLSVGEERIRGA